ncbi:MAG: UbiA family prenyltransferase [bacterium]
MKKKAMLVDYIFLLRPSIQAALWTFLFAGSYLYNKRASSLSVFSFNMTFEFALGLLGYTLIMGSVYVLNQISDIDTDTLNKKLFLLSEGIISKRSAYIYSLLCLIVGFSIFIFSGLFSINTIILVVVSYIMGILYTVRPFECKRRPFIDLILNGIGYGFIAPLIGFETAGGALDARAAVETIPYVLSMSAVFINTTLMDYDGDKAVGALTTGVFLGVRRSLVLSSSLMLLSAATGFVLKDYILFACAFYSLLLFIYASISRSRKSIDRSVKFTSPAMTLAFGILFPEFLIMSLIVLSAIFMYYRFRFNMKVV